MTPHELLRLMVVAVATLALTMPSNADNRRVALVVGVSNYQFAPKLPNSANDANAIGAALKRIGFTTEILIDPNRTQFEESLRRLGQAAEGAEASVFYFAGHALEASGQNLLLPIGANIKSPRDLRFETVPMDAALEGISGRSRVSLIFLDSCRDNPFAQQLVGSTRSTSFRGMGAVDATVGTLIAFATAPGKVAEDGDQKNSPFTTALLKHLEAPGIEVRRMLSEVRRDVRMSTGGRQLPWENSALEGDFYFVPDGTVQAKMPAATDVAVASPLKEQLPSKPPPTLKESILKHFALANPNRSVVLREKSATDYDAASKHKAQAILPGSKELWRVVGRENPAAAEQAALEGCQLRYAKPCALVAVNDDVARLPERGKYVLRDMPRNKYTGTFNSQMIPAVRGAALIHSDLLLYPDARGHKAMALHPWGQVFVETGAASLALAEKTALARCNADPIRNGKDGPCFLYAAGDQVVLLKRLTSPERQDAEPLNRRKQASPQQATSKKQKASASAPPATVSGSTMEERYRACKKLVRGHARRDACARSGVI